jgi:hypothetical protein
MTNPIHLAIQVAEYRLSGQGKKKVIDRIFIMEEKMAGGVADDRFLEQVLGKYTFMQACL